MLIQINLFLRKVGYFANTSPEGVWHIGQKSSNQNHNSFLWKRDFQRILIFLFLGRRLKVRFFPKKKLKEILRLPIFVHIILTVELRIGHSFKKNSTQNHNSNEDSFVSKSYSILDWNKLTPTNHEQLNIYNNCNGMIVNFNTAAYLTTAFW